MSLTIHRRRGGTLEMVSDLIRSEARDVVRLLDADTPRNTDLLALCSWCRKVRLAEERWEEVETAISKLGIFEQIEFPDITHGICPSCSLMIMEGERLLPSL